MKNEAEPKRLQRRPYVAPRIQRRRALSHAVLFSSTLGPGTVGISTTGTLGTSTSGTSGTTGTLGTASIG